VTGIPVLVLHGPLAIRAALGIAPDQVLVRPLALLVPTARIPRHEVVAIEVKHSHWCAPPVPGVPDGTENLAYLLRAWWRADPGRL
jgi:hypothetical protein